MKVRAKQQLEVVRSAHEKPIEMVNSVASAVAGAPSLYMEGPEARSYLDKLDKNTGGWLSPRRSRIGEMREKRIEEDPNLAFPAAVGEGVSSGASG